MRVEGPGLRVLGLGFRVRAERGRDGEMERGREGWKEGKRGGERETGRV